MNDTPKTLRLPTILTANTYFWTPSGAASGQTKNAAAQRWRHSRKGLQKLSLEQRLDSVTRNPAKTSINQRHITSPEKRPT